MNGARPPVSLSCGQGKQAVAPVNRHRYPVSTTRDLLPGLGGSALLVDNIAANVSELIGGGLVTGHKRQAEFTYLVISNRPKSNLVRALPEEHDEFRKTQIVGVPWVGERLKASAQVPPFAEWIICLVTLGLSAASWTERVTN